MGFRPDCNSVCWFAGTCREALKKLHFDGRDDIVEQHRADIRARLDVFDTHFNTFVWYDIATSRRIHVVSLEYGSGDVQCVQTTPRPVSRRADGKEASAAAPGTPPHLRRDRPLGSSAGSSGREASCKRFRFFCLCSVGEPFTPIFT